MSKTTGFLILIFTLFNTITNLVILGFISLGTSLFLVIIICLILTIVGANALQNSGKGDQKE
ncbi:hypothetical protein VQL36_02495 [Chengkuizengella sp. SCS-71B]|uniref:hypothetical protein n=1 Tax=Chengkuizengella sp. SCS-71B TaxID=3115290 RepID=UPI0032C21AA2